MKTDKPKNDMENAVRAAIQKEQEKAEARLESALRVERARAEARMAEIEQKVHLAECRASKAEVERLIAVRKRIEAEDNMRQQTERAKHERKMLLEQIDTLIKERDEAREHGLHCEKMLKLAESMRTMAQIIEDAVTMECGR